MALAFGRSEVERIVRLRLRELRMEHEGAWRPRCYLSGPMTGLPDFNKHAFVLGAGMLRDAGWIVYNPIENDAEAGIELEGKEGTEAFDFAEAMKRDLWQVCDSDAVFVMPGWEYSKGAKLEVFVAHEVGKPVYSLLSGRKIEREGELDWTWQTAHPFSSRKIEREDGPSTGQPLGLETVAPVPLDFGPEFRGVDPVTGGSKGRRQATFANMSLVADVLEARVHGFGVMKYPDEAGAPNWSRGMPWSWFYDALRRHIAAFWSGEDVNEESGLPHLAHARWMISNLIEYSHYGMGTDDRPAWRRRAA